MAIVGLLEGFLSLASDLGKSELLLYAITQTSQPVRGLNVSMRKPTYTGLGVKYRVQGLGFTPRKLSPML